MKIINPLYDKAFKYLMENEKLAKKVLSVILDVDVEEVKLENQETVLKYERKLLTLFRLDFKAVIKEKDGSHKTVLIELQKSKFSTDIQRFRNYLGSAYLKKDDNPPSMVEEPIVEYLTPYPIITIYILGYNLDDLPYLAVTVNREIVNAVSKEKIEVKSFFIEHLTHQSHIIQVRRLPEKRRTRLEKFLVFFNQAWCTSDGFIIDIDQHEIPPEFADIAQYLQGPVMDEAFRRNLVAEDELDQIFEQQEQKYLRKIEKAEQGEEEARKREEEARKREVEARKREVEARKREEIERLQKEEALKREEAERKQNETLILKLALQMKKLGVGNNEIARETGLTEDEINKLLIP